MGLLINCWAHMDHRKISSVLMLTTLPIILGGCSAVNLLFDGKQVFVSERNSEIGKPISKVLSSTRYYPYWENQPTHFKQHYKKVVEGEKTEYQFSQSTCEWALVVSDRTNVVTAWRYIRDTPDCAYKQFHEGPF
jgi:hypothetical protein